MANQYKNKVIYNGNTLIDISDTTAVASDVNAGKEIYLASGQKVSGTQQVYTVTNTLTNVTSNNSSQKSIGGGVYFAKLTPGEGYLIDSIQVTMGGVDITNQVFSGDDGSSGQILLQNKSVTPTASQQSVTADSGYDGLGIVTIDAAPLQNKTVSENGTVIPDSGYYGLSSVEVNVPSGSSGLAYATGSFTPSQDYATTVNVPIATVSEIGFTPSKFYLYLTDVTDAATVQYMVIRASFESFGNPEWYIKTTVRTTNTSGSIGATIARANWTTQANYYLYFNNGTIYLRTSNTFKLFNGISYEWLAIQ